MQEQQQRVSGFLFRIGEAGSSLLATASCFLSELSDIFARFAVKTLQETPERTLEKMFKS